MTHLPCLTPLSKERCVIVEYLVAQTDKKDVVTAATRRKIELLREYRTCFIVKVITGKVDVREVTARLPDEPSKEEVPWTDKDEKSTDKYSNGECLVKY